MSDVPFVNATRGLVLRTRQHEGGGAIVGGLRAEAAVPASAAQTGRRLSRELATLSCWPAPAGHAGCSRCTARSKTSLSRYWNITRCCRAAGRRVVSPCITRRHNQDGPL